MRHRCIILAENPGALVEFCGISVIERLLRTLQRCGLTRAIIITSTPEILERHLANPSPHRKKVALEIRRGSLIDHWPEDTDNVLVVSGSFVFDGRLLRLLDEQNSRTALMDAAALLPREWVSAQRTPFDEALRSIEALDIASHGWYSTELRRDFRPYCFSAPTTPAQRKLAERVLLEAAQKGAQDLPALVHAPIETFLISYLCKTPITPTHLTIFTNIVAWNATALFVKGHLAWGAVVALAVGVIDGLDGKQARVKVETTAAGQLEHVFDGIFENSWWIALAYYFQMSGQLPGAYRILALLLCAEVVGGIAQGSVKWFCGRSIDEMSGFDRAFRLVGARRNVHIWILAVGLLLAAPAKAFVVMAFWEAISAAIQLPRAAWILLFRSRSQTGDDPSSH